MSEDSLKAMNAHNASCGDWYAYCPRCGERFTGTPAQLLKGHGCEAADDGAAG